jgi:hypothetical protein
MGVYGAVTNHSMILGKVREQQYAKDGVISAGYITFVEIDKAMKISNIDNSSGHYKPNYESFICFLKFLYEKHRNCFYKLATFSEGERTLEGRRSSVKETKFISFDEHTATTRRII